MEKKNKQIEGRLIFNVGKKTVDEIFTNLIHLEEDNINQTLTEGNVYVIIESEMNTRRLKGKVHNIKLYDMGNNLIAYEDKEQPGKLVFNKN